MPMWLNQVYDALLVSREHQRCLDVNEVEWYIAQAADYAVGLNITKKLAQAYLRDAQRFVARAEQYLEENKLG